MPKKGENIYYRKDERWEGRYHKGRKSNGKIKYGYVYGETYQEVREKLDPLKKNAEITFKLYGKSVVVFQEWSLQWLEEISTTLKPATYASYSHKLRKYLWKQFGDLSMYQMDDSAIYRAIETWQSDGLSLSSIKVFFRLLNQAMIYAVKQGLVEKNPCTSVELPKYRKEKVRALTRSEQARLEKTVEADGDTRAKAASLALGTGMRIGEIAALKWTEVDLEHNIIHVNQTYQRVTLGGRKRTSLQLGSAKSQASQRVIPMSPKIHDLLENIKKQADETSEFVFTTRGKACEPRLLTYHFHRLREKANLANIHFHQLRHTFATRCLEATGKILSVSRMLGHSSAQLTTDIYYDSMLTERVEVILAMEQSLR